MRTFITDGCICTKPYLFAICHDNPSVTKRTRTSSARAACEAYRLFSLSSFEYSARGCSAIISSVRMSVHSSAPAAASPAAATPPPPASPPRARAASVREALNKAVAGGVSGGAAQGINVLALMWLRTTMNVQMVNGSSMRDAFKTLYAQVRFFSRKSSTACCAL